MAIGTTRDRDFSLRHRVGRGTNETSPRGTKTATEVLATDADNTCTILITDNTTEPDVPAI